MPSLSKAAKAHGAPLAKNLCGQIAKKLSGSFSIKEKLVDISSETKILMITDRTKLGDQGELLRKQLANKGLSISGCQADVDHEASIALMKQCFNKIEATFLKGGDTSKSIASSEGAAPNTQLIDAAVSKNVNQHIPNNANSDEDEFIKSFKHLKPLIN